MDNPPRVTVWNEYRHERLSSEVASIYPQGIHTAIAQHLKDRRLPVVTATLDDAEHGLSDEVLDQTDVLTWWGHMAHHQVEDAIVDRVRRRVLDGMGLIALHSANFSKPFVRLMGTSCDLKWRLRGERERLWVVQPGHPIASGLPETFEIPQAEMYGEPFDIPQPDELVLISWFQGGEVFRSGCCYTRGRGRVFYFRPGHETFPIYHQPLVMKVIFNAVIWAAPAGGPRVTWGETPEPLESIAPLGTVS